MSKLTKKKLKELKTLEVVRSLYPIKNADFIERSKKQVIERYGAEALNDFKVDNGVVQFRELAVPLVDENEPMNILEGTVTFYSTNYNFNSGLIRSWADIKDMKLTDTGWVLNCLNGNYYIYEIKGVK